jgi:hypothetical protein
MAHESMNMLEGCTTYLSGPMDFLLDRGEEARHGWRARVTDVLESWGVRVFDPWFKPMVRNLERYGIEDETSVQEREKWSFEDTAAGAAARGEVSRDFWPRMHIDLRMVDLSDFIIAYCPTNLYSVGTPHEIVVARQQRKPVLLVSPPVRYPRFAELRAALAGGEHASLLDQVAAEVVVKENPTGAPSQWYTALVNSESFFDGFGWAEYHISGGGSFNWSHNYLDVREADPPPARRLLPYLDGLRHGRRPQRWDAATGQYKDNDDWLLLVHQARERGAAT